MRGNGKINAFGQTILASDYGADDLTKYRDDVSEPARLTLVGSHADRHGSTEVLASIAVLDESMPAMVHRYDTLREPDFYDLSTGESVWLSESVVVTVPLDRLRDFRAYVKTRGLAPCGRSAYKLYVLVGGDIPAWDAIEIACKG